MYNNIPLYCSESLAVQLGAYELKPIIGPYSKSFAVYDIPVGAIIIYPFGPESKRMIWPLAEGLL